MRNLKNILCLADCDDATLDRAAHLARQNNTSLTLMHVFPEPPASLSHVIIGGIDLDLGELAVKELHSRLDIRVEPLRTSGLDVSTIVRIGTPAIEVVQDVIVNHRGLVMKTAEGKLGLRERLFGSLSQQLMRQCPCPVWIVKPNTGARFHRILAAVDPDPNDPVRDSLNGRILDLADSLASQEQAMLHVAHAWSVYGEHLLRRMGAFSDSDVETLTRAEEQKHRRNLDELAMIHLNQMAHVNLIKGDPTEVIPRIVSDQSIDLMILGTVCRTGIPGLVIGNTAENILDSVDCSVLTVKPEGFVSAIVPG